MSLLEIHKALSHYKSSEKFSNKGICFTVINLESPKVILTSGLIPP